MPTKHGKLEALLRDAVGMLRELARRIPQPLEDPPGAAAVADLVERAAVLGGPLPPEHLDLLRRHDGFDLNGLHVYATSGRRSAGGARLAGLVEANLDWRDGPGLDEHLVLADGHMDLYTMHLPTGRFEIRDRVPGNLISVHDRYADVIAAAVRSHEV